MAVQQASQYQLDYRPYYRLFRQPLTTNHGVWTVREGIIVRLTDRMGQVGWGEIAPIDSFGSESFAQALQVCQALPTQISFDQISALRPEYPACRFGLEAAWETLTHPYLSAEVRLPISRLLPSGDAALKVWQDLWDSGTRTFKWKIGVAPIERELEVFKSLRTALPSSAHLRLDANGGLNWQDACQWLKICDAYAVEFLEQPLPPACFDEMLYLSYQFKTPIALDESVATLAQLDACYHRGWRGLYVIKAAIVGSPQGLRDFCRRHPIDIVWSSAFETAIGRHFVLDRLIPSLPPSTRAIGFGINHWFAKSCLDSSNFEQLWQSL